MLNKMLRAMAVTKWASTGLGWGGGLSRLRTPLVPNGVQQSFTDESVRVTPRVPYRFLTHP